MSTPVSRRSILTIDDDDQVRSSIAIWIEDQGYLPLQARNGREGLELAQKHQPDLILLDLSMPEMDGLSCLEELRARGLGMPVIVISGLRDIADAAKAFRLGAWDYITKPIVDFALLEHTVSLALERRQLQVKVRQAEERYFNLVESLPLVIFSLNEGFGLEFVNQGCLLVLGFTPQEAMAEPDWLLGRVHPKDQERIRDIFLQNLHNQGAAYSTPCRMLHKSGQVVYVMLKSIPATGRAGETPPRVEGVILDITDRMILEKHLVQKEKVKTLGAISAEVAHEIRNPLVSIGGFARRLTRKLPGQVEASIILEESQRLERILDRIRDYLRPVSLTAVRFVLADAVRKCLEILTPELDANDAAPLVDVSAAEVLVEQDQDIMIQVVINLIRHTLHALPQNGTMWLKASESQGLVHLEVGGDQGQAVADPEKLFLPFEEGGESIGLPFCNRLLRTMGGSLGFEQTPGPGPGQGVFVMSVPKASATPRG